MTFAISAARGPSRTSAVSDVVVERTIRGQKIACREWGRPGSPVLIGIHGLSSNSLCFADIAEAAAAAGYHVIVPDLRGRNLSPATGPTSYGWDNHALDVVAIADAVGAKDFSVVGHSMGSYIAMELPKICAGRLKRMVLLDALGVAEGGAVQALRGSVDRLGKKFPSAEAYVTKIRENGVIKPFTKTWDRHFREEVAPVEGGVMSRTDRSAIDEDTNYAYWRSMYPQGFRDGWRALPQQTLVVRAGVPLAKYLGNIISEADAVAYKSMRGDELFKTVDANHYTVLTEPNTVDLVVRFLKGKLS